VPPQDVDRHQFLLNASSDISIAPHLPSETEIYKICFNCTEPLHSSALRCCNVMQYNAWYAAQYAVQYLYCIICKTMQYNAKSADLKLFVVGQSRFFCSNCSSKIWLNPTIIHEMNAQRKVLKRSEVETTLEQLVLLGTARCKERSSNNYQLITA